MEKLIKYSIRLTEDARQDIIHIKAYILSMSGYRETAEYFSKGIRDTISKLNVFAKAHASTGQVIQGYEVYYKPYKTYLIFYVIQGETVIVIRILSDRMQWQSVIKQFHFFR